MDDWDYTAIPEAEWSFVGFRASEGDDITAYATSEGLDWHGYCQDPNIGGPFTIGFQSYEHFLEKGPFVHDTPAEVCDQIREHALRHRRAGSPAVLEVIARLAVSLHQISLVLDRRQIEILRPEERVSPAEIVLHRGSVRAGDRVLGAAVAWGDRPVAHVQIPFTARTGETTRAVLDITDLAVTGRLCYSRVPWTPSASPSTS